MTVSRLVILLLLAMVGCNRINDPEQYLKWFNDPSNGYVKSREINNLTYSVQYRSPYQQAFLESKKSGKITKMAVDSLVKEYQHSTDFIIEIKVNKDQAEIKDLFSLPELKADYRSKLGAGLKLIAGGKTIDPIIYHMENTYEIGNKLVCLVSFPEIKDKAFTFSLNDEVLSSGVLNFTFDTNKEVPQYSF